MTVVNKFVVSGEGWNLFFFYLAVQVRVPLSEGPELDSQRLVGCRLYSGYCSMPASTSCEIGAV